MIRATSAATVPRFTIALALGLAFVTASGVVIAEPVTTNPPAITDAGEASSERLKVADATLEPATTSTVSLTLTSVPDGLSGYEVTLALDGDAATIGEASYPDAFALTTEPSIVDGGHTVTVEAADLGDEIVPGASDVTLATLTVEGTETGAAEVRVVDARLDADDGAAIDPAVESGTVRVESGDAGDAGREGTSGVQTADHPNPGARWGIGSGVGSIHIVASAAVGLVAVALGILAITRRRE